MRVAVFTDNDFAQVNGVTTTLTALLSHAPDDISPRIYTASTLGSDQPDYLALRSPSVPIPFGTETQMYVPRCTEYLRRVRADAIDVLHLTTPGPLGLTALWIAKRTGLPLVGSFHTKFGTYTSVLRGSSRLGTWMDAYMGWMYGRCRRVLVPCAAARDALMHRGVPWQQLTIWPNGIDTNLFRPSRRSATLRQEWRAGEDHPVLLYVGRVSRDKGLDLLPPLLKHLRALGVVCRMVVVGDGPLRRWLADACPETIFTGVLGRDAVADVFASADLFLFPSRTHTAGNVVLEAQASGLPVIVSDHGGLREQVVSHITGRVCPSADPARWASVANELLRDRDQLTAMGKAARSYALTRRWDRALEPLFETYRTVSAVPAAPVIDFLHADRRVVT